MKTFPLVLAALAVLGIQSSDAQWTMCTPVPGDNRVGSGTQLIYLAVDAARLIVPRPGGLDSIFYSDDNGASWNVSRVPPWVIAQTSYYPTVSGVWINRGTLFASGSVSQGNVFWRSTDAGVSWTSASSGLLTNMPDPTPKVLTASGTTMYAGTGGSGIFLTTDNGTTWNTARAGIPSFSFSGITLYTNILCLATIGSDVFAGLGGDVSGHYYGLRHATLGGTTWDSLGTGLPANVTVTSLLSVESTLYARLGLIAGNPLYKSTDLGATWTNSTNGLPPSNNLGMGAQGLYAAGGSIFANTISGEYVSTDGGGSWNPMNNTGLPATYYINGFAVIGSTMFITVVDVTTFPATTAVWKRELPQITGVRPNDPPLALTFSLDQNYPNPFNPSTTISYQLPSASNVSLVVYDLLGREVATLVNEWKSPGRYEVKLDAAALASSVYVYRLTAGSFVQSRKMLLLR